MATKIAGPRFAVLKGDMAKLQRSLISLMLIQQLKMDMKNITYLIWPIKTL